MHSSNLTYLGISATIPTNNEVDKNAPTRDEFSPTNNSIGNSSYLNDMDCTSSDDSSISHNDEENFSIHHSDDTICSHYCY